MALDESMSSPGSPRLVNEAQAQLLKAVRQGDMATVQQIVAEHATARTGSWYDTICEALHQAATTNRENIIEAILGCGVSPEMRNDEGLCPLHVACTCGHAGTVSALIAGGADVNASNSRGLRPLHCACGHSGAAHPVCVELLLNAGADVNVRDTDGRTPSKVALGLYVAFDGKGAEAQQAVAAMGHLEKAALRSRGAQERRAREHKAFSAALNRLKRAAKSPPRGVSPGPRSPLRSTSPATP
eukprot:TRINITY_DN51987_c0_g1_i1.p1 TRINITY_DN51987_c0_g1~~TRINITY_DN51987_c0_g1_i1.p1  ORF type:complete len:272 (+),score=60.33 TRINITY_DN51987_c0_g1_i1:89-817(+)